MTRDEAPDRLRHDFLDVNCAIPSEIACHEAPVLRASVELALEQG